MLAQVIKYSFEDPDRFPVPDRPITKLMSGSLSSDTRVHILPYLIYTCITITAIGWWGWCSENIGIFCHILSSNDTQISYLVTNMEDTKLWKHQNMDAFLVFNAKINFNIQHQFLKIETPEDNPEEIDPPMSSSIYKALRDLICKGSFVTSIGLQGIHGPPTTPACCMLFLSLTPGNTWSVPASHSDPENCPVSENVRPTLM